VTFAERRAWLRWMRDTKDFFKHGRSENDQRFNAALATASKFSISWDEAKRQVAMYWQHLAKRGAAQGETK